MRTLQWSAVVVAGALLAAGPARGQDSGNAIQAGGFSVPREGPFAPLAGGTYPGIAATSVTAGVQVNGLPCFTCVSGQTALNVGLSMPLAVLTQALAITITVLFEDTTYAGPCSATYLIKQSGVTIQKGTYNYPSGCVPNTFNGAFFNTTVQAGLGPVQLQGIVVAGTVKSVASQNLIVQ